MVLWIADVSLRDLHHFIQKAQLFWFLSIFHMLPGKENPFYSFVGDDTLICDRSWANATAAGSVPALSVLNSVKIIRQQIFTEQEKQKWTTRDTLNSLFIAWRT